MRRLLITLCMLPALASCSESTAPTGITDEQFIEAVVALRQAANAAGSDEAAYLAAREQVLAAQSITSDDLAAYIAAHSHDLDHLADVWEAVNTRLPDVEVH